MATESAKKTEYDQYDANIEMVVRNKIEGAKKRITVNPDK